MVERMAKGSAHVRTDNFLASAACRCFHLHVKVSAKRPTQPPDFKEQSRLIREFVDGLIKRGEAREFLVKNGFHTPGGTLTKRYGG